ncbi:hypothetical protein Droror1_Dr00025228 [Drosera rotundifolia]
MTWSDGEDEKGAREERRSSSECIVSVKQNEDGEDNSRRFLGMEKEENEIGVSVNGADIVGKVTMEDTVWQGAVVFVIPLAAFWKDPWVLFFSLHWYDFWCYYPATDAGFHVMIAEGPGKGYDINVPWEHGRCDSEPEASAELLEDIMKPNFGNGNWWKCSCAVGGLLVVVIGEVVGLEGAFGVGLLLLVWLRRLVVLVAFHWAVGCGVSRGVKLCAGGELFERIDLS